MKTREIEFALAKHFNYRMNIIIPNISWGLIELGHECDLFIIRPSNWAEEVEIKISKSDLRRDLEKTHRRFPNRIIRRLWYAMPHDMVDTAMDILPVTAGIISVTIKNQFRFPDVKVIHVAALNQSARKITESEKMKALSLGCMRIWTLKQRIDQISQRE